MGKEILDFTLIPAGLLMMAAYHVWLFYRIYYRPYCTVIGINSIHRRFWVHAMMEDTSKNGVLAVQTLRNNIMASTLLASMAIMLSSLIVVLMSKNTRSAGKIIYGDRSELAFSVKYFAILVCFLVAFLFNVQSIRYYSHASFLINVPCYKEAIQGFENEPKKGRDSIVEYAAMTVNRGSYFWSLGLRAFYFSFPLFLWIFGPIPMFISCPVLVMLLYFLDVTLDFGGITNAADDEESPSMME